MANPSPLHVGDAAPAALPPYSPQRRTLRIGLRQYWGLIQVMLREYRSTWFFHVMFGLLMPMGMIFLVKFMGDGITPDRASYMIGGSLTTSVVFGPTMMLSSKIGWGKQNREFEYWAALPLPKLALILGMFSVFLLFALPGLLGIFLLGGLLLGMPLENGLGLIPLVPIAALSLVGLGAFVGSYAKDGQTANAISNMMMAFVTFLSPTMIPLESMPTPLRIIAPFTPITYAADAFRAVLSGNIGVGLAYDLLILAAFALGFMILVHRKLDWRSA